MRYFFKLSLLLACAVAPAALFSQAPASQATASQATVMDEIVCKVNGEIVTRTELKKDRKDLEAYLREQGLRGEKLDEAVKIQMATLLRQRIDDLLLVQKAKEMDVKVDTELNKFIADLQRKYKIGIRKNFRRSSASRRVCRMRTFAATRKTG